MNEKHLSITDICIQINNSSTHIHIMTHF